MSSQLLLHTTPTTNHSRSISSCPSCHPLPTPTRPLLTATHRNTRSKSHLFLPTPIHATSSSLPQQDSSSASSFPSHGALAGSSSVPRNVAPARWRALLSPASASVVMVLSVLLFMGFAILNMAPMAQCVMVNGERSANGCTSCTNIQGCGWCPSSSMCLPFDLHQGDGRRGRHGRQPPPLPPMCNGSQLIGSPDKCPPPAPSAPALSPLP